jgi:hypothetical protein
LSDRPPKIPTPPRGGFAMDPDAARAKREAREAAAVAEAQASAEVTQRNRRAGLGIAGALFFLTGMYYLVLAPGEAPPAALSGILGSSAEGMRVVNLQRLTMGETFSIVGAIFSGFAWRPKA